MKRGGSGLTGGQSHNPEPPSHPPGQPKKAAPNPRDVLGSWNGKAEIWGGEGV